MKVNGVVPALPSGAVTSVMEIDGGASSFVIVPTAALIINRHPPVGRRVAVNVSSVSYFVSPLTSTVKV